MEKFFNIMSVGLSNLECFIAGMLVGGVSVGVALLISGRFY